MREWIETNRREYYSCEVPVSLCVREWIETEIKADGRESDKSPSA